MLILDGTNCQIGRVGAIVAKEAIKGEIVAIVNAEKMIISGNPLVTYARYKQKYNLRNPAKPSMGSKFPRRPDLFIKKILWGMFPKNNRGKEAYKNVKVYIGEPIELKGKAKKIEGIKTIKRKSITIIELCKKLGWRSGI